LSLLVLLFPYYCLTITLLLAYYQNASAWGELGEDYGRTALQVGKFLFSAGLLFLFFDARLLSFSLYLVLTESKTMRLIRSSFLLLCCCVVLSVVCSGQSLAPAPGVPLALAKQRKAQLSAINYQLLFTVPGKKEEPVAGKATISFVIKERPKNVVLDFNQVPGSVHELMVNGKKAAIRHENEHVVIAVQYLVTGKNKVEIQFEAGNAALNRNNDYMYALFVPERARTAFPCFDQPDLKAVFDLSLVVPANWKVMSNGPVVNSVAEGDWMKWKFGSSDTISTYLFSFTAGNFKVAKKTAGDREMEFFYRETDSIKLASSIPAIFDIHAQALHFLEEYTGIPYPFKKFSFAAIPDFQFGGMEHPGAIWYNAGSLFLDSSATRTQLIRRATLLAHETSHMWFGDLVTMQWFNDVWMKEVFANFMADKIVSVILPDDNADLKFITDHYPAAYSVDRTKGANPIRQPLDNLNEAGSLYGNIIYHKAPIMMLALERMIGENSLRSGLRLYLVKYAFQNATWPDLISILDGQTKQNLPAWNDVWVNKPGRPVVHQVLTDTKGETYGLFELNADSVNLIYQIKDPVRRVFTYLNLYENVIEGRYVSPLRWIDIIKTGLREEKDELISQLLLSELSTIYWVYLSPESRLSVSIDVENVLWEQITATAKPAMKKQFFKMYAGLALSDTARNRLYTIWKQKEPPAGVKLTDDDYTDLAAGLALRDHPASADILKEQLSRLQDPDKKMRWEFLLPSLSGDELVRDRFFESLKDLKNRKKEAWVNTAVSYLHYPLREKSAEKYIRPSLELLEELQRTGDIFFPQNWLQATLGMHQSARSAAIVQDFISSHPGYNSRLLNKLLQSADHLFRVGKVLK
jgi:aminopeptidase N